MPKLPPPPRSPQKRSGFSSCARAQQLAVDGDDVGGHQVVDGRAVAAHQPADAAAEREAGDAGVRDDAADRGQAVGLGGGVELAPQDAGAGASGPRLGIDVDRAHRRQVDHEAVVVDRRSRRCCGRRRARPARARGRGCSAAATSAALAQRAISAGRRSIAPFQTLRASSYSWSPGRSSSPWNVVVAMGSRSHGSRRRASP